VRAHAEGRLPQSLVEAQALRQIRRLHPVVLHPLDPVEERSDSGEEFAELRAGSKAPLVALDRVALDADHEMLGPLRTASQLPAHAVRIRVRNSPRPLVGDFKLFGPSRRPRIADVFDDHAHTDLILTNDTIRYCIVVTDQASTVQQRRGRARDPAIDARVLAVANRHLSAHGYEAMSLTAIAHEAQTTRQALYRRWPTKARLAAATLHAAADAGPDKTTADPLADLTAELANFARGVSRPGRLSLVGTMLQDNTAPEVLARYRAQVVAPRRGRIRAILERGQRLGLIESDADLDVAVTLCTGSWYGRALAEPRPPVNWPARTAALVWRAVGGTPPKAQTRNPERSR